MINNKLESLSSKSCLEDAVLLEENGFCKVSCSEGGHGCIGDILPMKLGDIFLGPSTHFHNGEVSESLSSGKTEYHDLSSDCLTPAKSIFDPYAPGPEDLMLAPKKKTRKVESIETDETEDSDTEEHFSEFIFSSLVELIISTQLLEISMKNQAADSDQPEYCKTPLPLLTGIAGTCPPAPMRPILPVKRLSHSVCRKLDFGSTLTEF